MTWAVTKDVILFGLAIYGAGLSTFNLIKAVRKDQRKVLVKVGTKIPAYTNGELGDPWTHIEVTNAGLRPVTIKSIALRTDGGGRIHTNRWQGEIPGLEDTQLPATLADGQSAHSHHADADIAQALLAHGIAKPCRLTPVCEDSAGGVHKGKPIEVDPQAHLRR